MCLKEGCNVRRCLGRTGNLRRCQREGDWRFFCHDHVRQPLIWLFTFIFTVLGGTASIYSVLAPPARPVSETIQGSRGEQIQKFTLTGFERELLVEASERIKKAKTFFEGAEQDFAAKRYRDASNGYQK